MEQEKVIKDFTTQIGCNYLRMLSDSTSVLKEYHQTKLASLQVVKALLQQSEFKLAKIMMSFLSKQNISEKEKLMLISFEQQLYNSNNSQNLHVLVQQMYQFPMQIISQYLNPAVRIANIDNYGRGLIANKALQQSEIILVESALLFGSFINDPCPQVLQQISVIQNQTQLKELKKLTPLCNANANLEEFSKNTVEVYQRILSNNVFRGAPNIIHQLSFDQTSPSALCLLGSLMNHSCIPNTNRYFIGNVLVVSALCDIKPDEQIFTYYNLPFYQFEEERLKRLQSYGFECKCEFCNQDSESLQLLKHFSNQLLSLQSRVLELKELPNEAIDEIEDEFEAVQHLYQGLKSAIRNQFIIDEANCHLAFLSMRIQLCYAQFALNEDRQKAGKICVDQLIEIMKLKVVNNMQLNCINCLLYVHKCFEIPLGSDSVKAIQLVLSKFCGFKTETIEYLLQQWRCQ